MPFCLFIVYGYICTMAAEFNGCKKTVWLIGLKYLLSGSLRKKIAHPCFRPLRVTLNFALPPHLLHRVEAISETPWTSPL